MTSCVHMKQQWTAHAHADELNIALLNKTHLVSSCFMIFCKLNFNKLISYYMHHIIISIQAVKAYFDYHNFAFNRFIVTSELWVEAG
ncbi:hypothetical protein T06_16906 [Trichinella sp. T6]|nr:hypothetical protein T06_16906 [Trichinella sp. T6]